MRTIFSARAPRSRTPASSTRSPGKNSCPQPDPGANRGIAPAAGRDVAPAGVALAYFRPGCRAPRRPWFARWPRRPGERAVRHRRPRYGLGRSGGFARGPLQLFMKVSRSRSRPAAKVRLATSCSSAHCWTRTPAPPVSLPRSTTPPGNGGPGSFVTAEIPGDEAPAAIVVPKSALQSLKGESVVFVRTADGFEARRIDVGRQDARQAEVKTGLAAGERIARPPTRSSSRLNSARPRSATTIRAARDDQADPSILDSMPLARCIVSA